MLGASPKKAQKKKTVQIKKNQQKGKKKKVESNVGKSRNEQSLHAINRDIEKAKKKVGELELEEKNTLKGLARTKKQQLMVKEQVGKIMNEVRDLQDTLETIRQTENSIKGKLNLAKMSYARIAKKYQILMQKHAPDIVISNDILTGTGNMGDMSELIYLARNEPEKFQEMFSKAAAGMAQFNEKTGEIEYNAEAMQRFRAISTATGANMNDLVEGGRALKKELMIKDELDASIRGLNNYDALLSKVSGAAYRNDLGEWVVNIKEGGKEMQKAVSALTEEQIKQISFTDETKGPEQAFENIAKSNETLNETMSRLIETIKTQALSSAPYEQFSQVARVAADNIKELAAPLVKSFSELNEKAMENVLSVIKPLSEGNVGGAMNAAKENLTGAANKAYEAGSYALGQMGTILYNVFTNAAKYLAAGIEWGFKNSIGLFQNAFYTVYDNTFGLVGMFARTQAQKDAQEKSSRVSFKDVISGYDIKGILEDTTMLEDFNKMLGYNTDTKTSTTPNVTNTSVPEIKKEPEAIEKKLTSANEEKTKKVEVSFTNPITLDVQGNTSQLNDKNIINEEIEKALNPRK